MITFRDLGLSPAQTAWLVSLLSSPELQEVTEDIVDYIDFLESDYFLNKISEKGYFPCEITAGASKLCFIPKDYSFVIKWSKNSNGQRDEAAKEAFIYERAKEKRLKEFFPKTEELESPIATRFVYQEKIDYTSCQTPVANKNTFINKTSNSNNKVVRRFRQGMYIDAYLNETWSKMALLIYGKRKCRSLVRFIHQYYINDLHDGNTGYLNNKPIILDFSGYTRESW